MIYGSRLWPYNVPFVKGGSQGTSQQGGMGSPETRVSGECWSNAKHGACTKPYCQFKHTCLKCQRQHKGAYCEYSCISGINTETPKIANCLLTGYEKGEIKYLVSGYFMFTYFIHLICALNIQTYF